MSTADRARAARLVQAVTGWAKRRDPAPPAGGAARPATSWIAAAWAVVKLAVVAAITPIWAPVIMARAAVNNRRARGLARDFPVQVRALADGRIPRAPSNRVLWVNGHRRIVLFSDLHRCVPGRLDWPARQGTKRLYELILGHYAGAEWSLCENGDVEDFWIVGGSTYGATYDVLRMTGGALDRYHRSSLLTETYRRHLDEIIENNQDIYRRIRDDFVAPGHYFRTIGNHDSPVGRPEVAQRLRQHLGDFPLVDYIALSDEGGLIGVVAHGHHTDGWNAPVRENLGKLSAWIANTLIDVPRLETPEGLPPPGVVDIMRAGELPDRLLTVHPTFGANSDYDSLDEELLFEAVHTAGIEDVWMLLGHTHFPVAAPLSRTGRRWARYLNSGSGVNDGMITAIEWDGTGREPTARLVAWTMAGADTPPAALITTPAGDRLARYVLEPDGDRLRPRV